MAVERRTVEVHGVHVEIVRKDIKHIHLRVYPPHGKVRMSAPLRVGDDTVRSVIASRLPWIRAQQKRIAGKVYEARSELVTGETQWFAGQTYALRVVEGERPQSVVLRDGVMELHVRPGSGREARKGVLDAWYRKALRESIPSLLARWEAVIGVDVAECRIKRMKTRWGSCNVEARRIWLNLELAKKAPPLLEAVLVHEMVHLLERHHNDCFKALMDRYLPDWRARWVALNGSSVGAQDQEAWR